MGKRVLVVDNDRFYVELLGDILGQEGYEVAKAYDGMEAIEMLERERPDLVFLDIVMPKVDGDRVCQYIKGNPRTQQIPVVILSSTVVEDREKMLAMGADAYVAKGRLDDVRRNVLATLQRLRGGASPGTQAILGVEQAVPREVVKELLAVRRHKEAILRTIVEGVVEVDARHRVVYVNPAGLAILGQLDQKLVGTSFAEILTAEHRDTLRDAAAGLKASPEKSAAPVTLRCRERVLRLSFAWIAADDPESGFFMILQDITDLVRKIEELSSLNTRLQELDRTRSEFLAMVSHDLHTPLTAIKGSLDVLLGEKVGAELSRELLGIAQKNTDRLFRMVSDMLDLVRIEAGRLEMRRQPFDVVVILRGTMDRLRKLAQDKEITLTLQAADGLPWAFADTLRVEQVFTNLLGNALKFTPRGGQITATAQELGSELLIQIRDSGLGIPAEHLDRVFDRFFRVALPGGEQVGGTGLGLSICKAIVEEHGGRIWVESTVGRGSTFSVTLPKESPR